MTKLLNFNNSLKVLFIILCILLPLISSKFIDFAKNSNTIDKVIKNSINKTEEKQSYGFLIDLLSNAFRLLNLRKVVKDVQQGKSSSGTSTCMSCKFGFAMAQHLIQFGKGKDELAEIAGYLCKTLNLETVRVCEGMVDQFKVCMGHTVSHSLALSPTGPLMAVIKFYKYE